MNLTMQYLTVLAMSGSGAVLGAVYDVYRTILKEWKYLRWMGPIFDFAFWIFALLLVLWTLHWANNGDMRLYVFLLIIIGLVLYRLLLSKFVIGSTVRIVLAITYTLQMIYRLFLITVVAPLLWLWRLVLAIVRMIDRLASVLERVILWPFKPLLATVEWIGRTLYRWTIVPLIEPVVKPLKRQLDRLIQPVHKFIKQSREKWKGFLRRVAKWLVDSDEDDDKPKS
ncbi:MAG: spore cortex biosynthesis protein YabQ [Tumebacillaceae bacterium]